MTVKLTLIICKESRDAINLFSFTSLVLLPFLQNYPVQNGRVPKILKSFKTTFVKLKFLSLLILHAFALNDRNKNIIVSDRDTSCFQLIFVRKSSKILCRNELCWKVLVICSFSYDKQHASGQHIGSNHSIYVFTQKLHTNTSNINNETIHKMLHEGLSVILGHNCVLLVMVICKHSTRLVVLRVLQSLL